MNKETRDAVVKVGKEKQKDGLFLAEYSYADRSGKTVELFFTYREPTGAELQAYAEMTARDSIEAGRWLLKQLVVSTPGGDDILKVVGNHNVAVSTFLTEYLNPLYGKVLETKPIRSL